MSAPDLIACASLKEFFRNSVDAAMAANSVAVDRHTAHYVVELLTLFARSECFFDQATSGNERRPLALMLVDANEASSGDERNVCLQRVGDVALFVSGFMVGALDRSPVGIDYYVKVGGGAYHSLSRSLPPTVRGRTFAPIFAELAARFQDMVDVLTEIRHAAGASRDADVLRLYDQWLTTGSRRAERLLRRLGVHPTSQAGSLSQH